MDLRSCVIYIFKPCFLGIGNIIRILKYSQVMFPPELRLIDEAVLCDFIELIKFKVFKLWDKVRYPTRCQSPYLVLISLRFSSCSSSCLFISSLPLFHIFPFLSPFFPPYFPPSLSPFLPCLLFNVSSGAFRRISN